MNFTYLKKMLYLNQYIIGLILLKEAFNMKHIFGIIICIAIIFTACNSKQTSTPDDATFMNVSTNCISKVELYENGTLSSLSFESSTYNKLIEIINSHEDDMNLIDGGLSMELEEFGNYKEYSSDISGDVYVLKFNKNQHIVYSDYDTKKTNTTSIIVVPNQNFICAEICDEKTNEIIGYATLTNLEKDIFEALD